MNDIAGTPPSAPVRDRVLLAETAYQDIKLEIMENRFSPGFQASEPELATRLEMSRTPVHEALLRLANEGLVELIPRRGMRVLPLSPDDMREIYELLTCVESEAVGLLAAASPTPETLAPLDAATAEMERALAARDLDAWARADSRYHREMVELCPNRRLGAIARTYQDQAHRARMFTLRLRELPARSTQEHHDQVAAILANTGDVRAVYRAHRERAGEEIMSLIAEYRLQHL